MELFGLRAAQVDHNSFLNQKDCASHFSGVLFGVPSAFQSNAIRENMEVEAPSLCVPLICHANMDKLYLVMRFTMYALYFRDSSV